MLNWLKTYWPVLIIGLLMLAVIDGTFSSLMTCHPITDASAQNANSKQQQECTALAGPILTVLIAIVDFLDGHSEAVTAVFTIVLAVFTGSLWWSTAGMLRATSESIGLANREFSSSHRPKMRLKHVWLTSLTDWRLGGPMEVNLDIVNVGNTIGFITWINYDTIILPVGIPLPQRPPYDEFTDPDVRTTRFRTNTPLPSGVTLPRPVCDGRILDDQGVHEILWGTQQLYLIGTIEYVDSGGIGVRQTAFCRRLRYNNYPPRIEDFGRFEIIEDSDYEYYD